PAGELLPMPEGILAVMRTLAPVMGIDASRPWSMGILFRGQGAYVTNSIVIVEHWLPVHFSRAINIPAMAVKEMLRIGIEPAAMQLEERAVTFHYPNGAWLRTALLSAEWPDLSRVLDHPCEAKPFPVNFFE